MRSIPAKVPFLAIFIALLFPLALIGAGEGESEKRASRVFQEQVETAAGDSEIPGLVVALQENDGHILVGAVGVADLSKGTPIQVASSFYIGSISQSMMAAIVFMLQEEGKLELEDPISRYMEFPGGESVTIEMLLDHSSGFADWTGRDLTSTDNEQLPKLLKSPQNTLSLLKIAAEAKPIFEPGTMQEGSYSNLLILSWLIGEVEGKPPSEVFEERIFAPLGMENTRFLGAGERLESLAKGYRSEKGWGKLPEDGLTDVSWADESLRDVAYMGIVSNAEDVLKYHVGLRNGGLISEKSFARMRRVRPGKFNGLGYQISKGVRGTWEGNNGHAVGHLTCSYYNVEEGVYLVLIGNLGDTALPLTRLWDLRYGDSNDASVGD